METGTNGRLKLALTKGRLEKKTIALFEKMGLDCSVFSNYGRKLVISLPDYPLDIVLAKASDVITYVENGVCDLGIVGKDTIMEYGRHFFEALDLGFGKCGFVLAEREGGDFYNSYKSRSVATKYPGITSRFFTRKGMDVNIIKIEGSVELAPILGLADAIVDIVETGSTLRENGLVPIEYMHKISARLIVNVASMRMGRAEIKDFIERCKKAVSLG